MRRLPLIRIVLVCLVALLSVGCGKTEPTGVVKGKVTLDDAPYTTDGSVVFMSLESGQAGASDIQSDGTFSLEAPLPVGSYVVFIGPKSTPSDAGTDKPAEEKIDESLPNKYRGETTTDIKVDIVKGINDVTVPLKTKG